MRMCCLTDPGCEAGRHPGDSTEMGSSYGAPIISVIRFVASGVEGVVDLGTVSDKSNQVGTANHRGRPNPVGSLAAHATICRCNGESHPQLNTATQGISRIK